MTVSNKTGVKTVAQISKDSVFCPATGLTTSIYITRFWAQYTGILVLSGKIWNSVGWNIFVNIYIGTISSNTSELVLRL